MLAEVPVEQTRGVLDRCADDLLWEAGVAEPPVDAYAVADRLGMVVTRDAALRGRARFARLASESVLGGVETIVLADERREERRQFAVAHEVGEAHAIRVYDTLGIDSRETAPRTREAVANALAGRLLAPRRWLQRVWRECDGDLIALKRVFRTASHELLARRVLECVAAPTIVTVTDNGRVVWRRTNTRYAAPPRTRLEVECQRRAHATAAPVAARSDDDELARVRCWPIHEEGWRREIAFSELHGDEW